MFISFELRLVMMKRLDSYILRRFGFSILEELKVELLSYRKIGRVLIG